MVTVSGGTMGLVVVRLMKMKTVEVRTVEEAGEDLLLGVGVGRKLVVVRLKLPRAWG